MINTENPSHTQALYAKLDDCVSTLSQQQAEHLQCKAGCSACCENGAGFIIRRAEWLEIQAALATLPPEQRASIANNIQRNKDTTVCPLLINNHCSVYAARPAICRAYGLLVQSQGQVATCHLNYNTLPTSAAEQHAEQHAKQNNLAILDIDPFYALLDEISAHQATSHKSHGDIKQQSIRDWMHLT